jgi:hypothetical protein
VALLKAAQNRRTAALQALAGIRRLWDFNARLDSTGVLEYRGSGVK